jgi:hypothetical protein
MLMMPREWLRPLPMERWLPKLSESWDALP